MGTNDFEGSDGGPLPRRTVTLRMPKVVQWRPQTDITAYELALSVNVLFGIALGGKFPEDDVARLPPEAQRHFVVGDHPVFK